MLRALCASIALATFSQRRTIMENTESTSKQGAVSAPGESPKDINQNTYTEGETSLATEFKVEPKLVRLRRGKLHLICFRPPAVT